MNLADPGTNVSVESDLAAHYIGILGANAELDSTIVDFCTDPDRGPYEMELIQSSSSRRPQCIDGNAGRIANNGLIVRNDTIRFRSISDGTSKTALIGEAAFGFPELQDTRAWFVGGHNEFMYTARNLTFGLNSGSRPGPRRNDIGFGSVHPGGSFFGYADGSIQFTNENVELRVIYALASRSAGEILSGE